MSGITTLEVHSCQVTLTKGGDFTGKIEYSMDKTAWSETAASTAPYIRAGY